MKQRIAIVGAGFAGLWSALGAARVVDIQGKRDHVEVVLIAPEPTLHVRPRLYERGAAQMVAPLKEIFDLVEVRYVQGHVEEIRTAARELTVADPKNARSVMSYDRLVLAAGSRLFQPDIPGLKAHAFNVDQIGEAIRLEKHIAALSKRPDTPSRNTVVVAGGGFTGIEAAAEMPARLRDSLGEGADIKVIIVEQAAEIGPDLGPGPRPVIKQALAELGVSVRAGNGVAAIEADGVRLSGGEHIASHTVIWTAGARASALTEQIPGTRDRYGRLHVNRDLGVAGVEGVFASGDVAHALTDDEGHVTMMSCQHAMNLGRFAGHNVAADLLGLKMLAYSQPRYVTCLDLGPWGAVFTEGWDRQVKLVGAQAKALKRQINTQRIYPPRADRAEALAAADPLRMVVA